MRNVPIRRRLFLLVAAAAVPLAAMSAFALFQLYTEQRAQAERAALEIARAIATSVEGELRSHAAALQVFAASPTLVEGDLAVVHGRARRIVASQPAWRAMTVSSADGRKLLSTAVPYGAPLPAVVETASVATAARTGRWTVGPLVRGPHYDWSVPVRVPVVRGNDTRFVLTAVVDPEAFVSLLGRHRIPAGWVVAMSDSAGVRLARSRAQAASLGTPFSPSLQRLMKAVGEEGGGVSQVTEGESVYTAFTTIPGAGWRIAVGIPQDVLEAGARQSFIVFGSGIALSTLAGLLAALFLARSVSTPMAELREAARALGRGERPLPPETDVREIAEVADALFASEEERAQAEAEREDLLRSERQARAAAEAANRAKDEFLAMLGHELRNPLAAISNATSLLEHPGMDEGRKREARAIIARQVSHLTRLTDDLLDAGRALMGKIKLQRRPLDLAAVAAQSLATLRASGRTARHPVIQSLEPAWVDADLIRLDQIISNLVVNAAKYTPAGKAIRVTVAREGEQAVLRVADEGIGIPPGLVPRVFDLFVQGDRELDRALGGLGIGLTLVRRLAEMHGGTATAHSEGEGRGAEFVVRLPAIAAPSDFQPAVAPPAAGATAGRDILVVEDNKDARETLKMLLELQGHRVHAAADGVEGLEAALHLRPEVMLVDVGLPRLDGYELARRVRSAGGWAQRPLMVAVTGYGQPEDRARALEAGFDAHLAKPVDAATLEEILGRPAAAIPT